MKKVLTIIAAFLLAGFSAMAQEKGEYSVEGVIGFGGTTSRSVVNTNGNKTSTALPSDFTFTFKPMFNYFVMNNLELSAGLDYALRRDNATDDSFSTANIAMFVVGAHYYVPLVKGSFFYTPGLEVGFGGGSYIYNDGESNKDITKVPFAFGLNINLGNFEFKPLEKWGFTVNLLDLCVSTVSINTGVDDVKMYTAAFNYAIDYGASVGVKYYF